MQGDDGKTSTMHGSRPQAVPPARLAYAKCVSSRGSRVHAHSKPCCDTASNGVRGRLRRCCSGGQGASTTSIPGLFGVRLLFIYPNHVHGGAGPVGGGSRGGRTVPCRRRGSYCTERRKGLTGRCLREALGPSCSMLRVRGCLSYAEQASRSWACMPRGSGCPLERSGPKCGTLPKTPYLVSTYGVI